MMEPSAEIPGGRLILVSNRLPVTVSIGDDGLRIEPSAGGLATGLREPHRRLGGPWVGWPGPYVGPDGQGQAALDTALAELGTVPVHMSAEEVSRFYEGFANGVLWPVFHYLIGQVPLRVEGWEEYRAVNERFADTVADLYRVGDSIWVHDYQLLLLPGLLRQRLPRARIGFFLHIPFPSSEVFATLPHREQMLRGLLGADVVGFHTEAYARHFLSSLRRVLGIAGEMEEVRHEGRPVRLGAFPMGVDAAALDRRARAAPVEEEVRALRGDGSCRLLLGIDRLDYTKGIPRRLLAFELLLQRRPEWRGRVRLIQVAVPSRARVRAYRAIRREVDALVGRINGEFGTPHWTPVHYLYQSVPEHQLLALYRAADVMLVTPVRDGMNLVAKEFVAARSDEGGVLVLSEFAGAAAEMQAAVRVNPYDLEQSAQRYHQALVMPAAERGARMRSLREHVFGWDVHRWAEAFLAALDPGCDPAPEGRP
ncbi:MAG: bifunctional alpha,alpha-trehalose-phosphate synthase (UDP-forming)/trehalose-phosphatase [Gemmatimonadota bacterium]